MAQVSGTQITKRPKPRPKFWENGEDMANPLSLPSITGGAGGSAGPSGASSGSNTISGNFSVGGSSATDTIRGAAFPILLTGGVIFIGALLITRIIK